MLVGLGWASTACTWLQRGSTPAADTLWTFRQKNAFLCVDDQTRITQPGEDCPQMLQMLLLVLAGDDDAVQVAEDEGMPHQDLVHHALECVARIAQPERHAAKKS